MSSFQSFLQGLRLLEGNICNAYITPRVALSLEQVYFDHKQNCHPLMLVLRTLLLNNRDVMTCSSIRLGVLFVIKLIQHGLQGHNDDHDGHDNLCNIDSIPLHSIVDICIQMSDKCKEIISNAIEVDDDGGIGGVVTKRTISIQDISMLNNIITSMVRAHALAVFLLPDDLHVIQDIIVTAFLKSNQSAISTSPSSSPHTIIYELVSGYSPSYTCIYTDTLYVDIYSDPNYEGDFPLDTVIRNVKIAIFNETLEINSNYIEQNNVYMHINAQNTLLSSILNITAMEHEAMDNFVHMLINAEVKLLCCQKLIHPYLKDKLHAHGIFYIERISLKYVGALQALSGATMLGNMDIGGVCMNKSSSGLDGTLLGYVSTVTRQVKYDKKYIVFSNNQEVETDTKGEIISSKREKNISTVFIAAHAEYQCKILQHNVFEPCLLCLSKLHINPCILSIDWPCQLVKAVQPLLSSNQSNGVYAYANDYMCTLLNCWKTLQCNYDDSDVMGISKGSSFSLPIASCLSLFDMVQEVVSVVLDIDADDDQIVRVSSEHM